jgi:molybdate transport system substrate-binding protein
MDIARRRILLAAAASLPAMATRSASAGTTDLAVMCDPALDRPLGAARAAYYAHSRVRIHVFPTAPGLILPQLAHDVQNDILVTQLGILDQAAQAGLLAAGPRSGNWRNGLVVAEMTDAAGPADAGKFAVSELPSASGIDGAAIAARLGVNPAQILSAIDTAEVAFLLKSGAARTGLLYRTDVIAEPRLRVRHAIEDWPPAIYAAAVTKGARRPNPAVFIEFLQTAQAGELLAANGLELLA